MGSYSKLPEHRSFHGSPGNGSKNWCSLTPPDEPGDALAPLLVIIQALSRKPRPPYQHRGAELQPGWGPGPTADSCLWQLRRWNMKLRLPHQVQLPSPLSWSRWSCRNSPEATKSSFPCFVTRGTHTHSLSVREGQWTEASVTCLLQRSGISGNKHCACLPAGGGEGDTAPCPQLQDCR